MVRVQEIRGYEAPTRIVGAPPFVATYAVTSANAWKREVRCESVSTTDAVTSW